MIERDMHHAASILPLSSLEETVETVKTEESTTEPTEVHAPTTQCIEESVLVEAPQEHEEITAVENESDLGEVQSTTATIATVTVETIEPVVVVTPATEKTTDRDINSKTTTETTAAAAKTTTETTTTTPAVNTTATTSSAPAVENIQQTPKAPEVQVQPETKSTTAQSEQKAVEPVVKPEPVKAQSMETTNTFVPPRQEPVRPAKATSNSTPIYRPENLSSDSSAWSWPVVVGVAVGVTVVAASVAARFLRRK